MTEHEREASESRTIALAQGILIDVTTIAKQAGLFWPTAVTVGVYQDIMAIPTSLRDITNEAERLWEVLWCGRIALERERVPLRSLVTVAYEMVLPIGTARLYSVKLVLEVDADGTFVVTLCRAGD